SNLKGENPEEYYLRHQQEFYSREMQKYEEFNKRKIEREFKLLFGYDQNLINHVPSPLFSHSSPCFRENRHNFQSLSQNLLAPDKETLKTMLIEVLNESNFDVEHVNPRTHKIMIDQSVETMQVVLHLRLRGKDSY